MALPLLARLSASARSAYPFIRRAVSEGMSVLDTQILLQEVLFPVPRNELLRVINAIRREFRLGADLREWPMRRVIGESVLHTAITPLRRRFSFEVLIRGIDTRTGNPRGQFITVTTDRLLTREQIEAEAERFAVGGEGSGGMEDVTAELVAGRKAGSAGTL